MGNFTRSLGDQDDCKAATAATELLNRRRKETELRQAAEETKNSFIQGLVDSGSVNCNTSL